MAPRSTKQEAQALYYAGAAYVVASAIGLAFFWGKVSPLFGHTSIGNVASVLAALAAFCGFLITYRAPQPAEMKRLAGLRNGIKVGAIAFIHAAICLLLTVVAFYLAQDAFQGVKLDQWVSALLSGLAAAASGYAAFLTGAGMNTLRLSTSVAVFLVSGVMVSMITTQNPYWWQLHFSSLGGSGGVSAVAFNITLIIAGLVIVCLSDFVAADFKRLQVSGGSTSQRAKVRAIRMGLALIGTMLALVGLFKYDVHPLLHALAAGGMAIVFIGLLAFMPRLAPGFSRAFFLFSYAMLGALLACNWLATGVGYLNLTAFELISGALIFLWVIVFVRNLAVEPSAVKASPR